MSNRASGPERSHPFVQLHPEELAAIVSPVLRAAPEELSFTELPGHVNSSYRVTHTSGDWLVRLLTGDLNAYLKEFNALSRYGDVLPLPKPSSFQLSSTASRGYAVAIHQWIDGITLDEYLASHPEQTAAAGQSVGKTLAQFAKIPFSQSGFLSPQLSLAQPFQMNRVGYLDYLNGLLTQSLAGQRLDKMREPIWQYVSFQAKWLDTIPTQYNLVHGNLRRKNVLVSPNSENVSVVGLLDWEFAMSWSSLFDLSQLLATPLPKLQEFERELTSAYVSHGGHVPQAWGLIKNLLQLLSACDLLARPTCPPGEQQTAMERIAVITRG